jgi:hypothetical protein
VKRQDDSSTDLRKDTSNITCSKDEKNISSFNINDYQEKPKNEHSVDYGSQNVTIANLKDFDSLPNDIENNKHSKSVVVHVP